MNQTNLSYHSIGNELNGFWVIIWYQIVWIGLGQSIAHSNERDSKFQLITTTVTMTITMTITTTITTTVFIYENIQINILKLISSSYTI